MTRVIKHQNSFRNMADWKISLPAKTETGQISVASIVPPMLVPRFDKSLKTGDEHKPKLDMSEDTVLDRIAGGKQVRHNSVKIGHV